MRSGVDLDGVGDLDEDPEHEQDHQQAADALESPLERDHQLASAGRKMTNQSKAAVTPTKMTTPTHDLRRLDTDDCGFNLVSPFERTTIIEPSNHTLLSV